MKNIEKNTADKISSLWAANKDNNSTEFVNEHTAMPPRRLFRHSTQFFQHHIPTEFMLLGVVDFILLAISFYLALEIRFLQFAFTASGSLEQYFSKAMLYSVVMLLCLIAFGAYQRKSRQPIEMLALRIGGSLAFGMVLLGVTFYIAPALFLGRGVIALSVFISFVSLMTFRSIIRRFAKVRDLRLRVLVLGAGNAARLIKADELSGKLGSVNIIGYMPMPGDRGDTDDVGMLIDAKRNLIDIVAEYGIDEIVVAADERRQGLPVQALLDCKMSGVEVIDLLTFFERETGKIRLDIMQPSWLFLSNGFRESTFRLVEKRLFDFAAAMLLLPFVLPLMVLSSLAILVESRGRGPVLYTQTRVSKNGELFRIYKFRSMIADAEQDGAPRWAAVDDSRITRVGSMLRKYRLDELPQIFNVLRGDMSFVGPRPERPEFVEQLAETIPYYHERHRVKPGLTGWAQIRYSYGANAEETREKLQYDLYYVKNYSLLLDMLVLLQTADVVLLGKGAR